MSLVGIRVEIHHVARFLRRLCAGIHRDADIGLCQCRGIVGAVAGHGDELAVRLFFLDQRHLVLGRRLREEVVDTCFRRDCRGGQRIVSGDHDRPDPHCAQVREALAHAALDDVLQVDDAEWLPAVGDDQRRAAGAGNALHDSAELLGHDAAA